MDGQWRLSVRLIGDLVEDGEASLGSRLFETGALRQEDKTVLLASKIEIKQRLLNNAKPSSSSSVKSGISDRLEPDLAWPALRTLAVPSARFISKLLIEKFFVEDPVDSVKRATRCHLLYKNFRT